MHLAVILGQAQLDPRIQGQGGAGGSLGARVKPEHDEVVLVPGIDNRG